MSGRLFFWAITSALAGFLFCFDTVVISGRSPAEYPPTQPDERVCAA
jgi:hypothetical protein